MLTQSGFAIIVVGFFLVMQLAILIVGKIFGKLAMLVSTSNILLAVSIISYWMLNLLFAPTHFIELREVVVLCAQVLVITSASYSLVLQHNSKSFK